ncbi:MAG: hypothetical protein CL524_11945 [Aequorivita sp.]|nr:hypothetical protein [Aequorivita sp.]
MPGKNDIDPLSITDGKISNLANINPKKLAKATEGQILVAQSDGRFAAKSLTGDITLEASGATSVTSTTTTTDGETTVVTGPAGPTGAQGPAGAQGAQGPAGSDATVTTSAVDSAGAVMETDLVQTSAGAGDASKPIKLDSTGKIDASMIDDGDISYNNIADVPSTFAPSSHNHDDRYYTESETDTLLATKATSGHNHDTAYLGITAKAADSDKLDGQDSTAFAAASHNHDHNALTNYNAAEHRVIDDSSTSDQDKLWSAYNITTNLALYTPLSTYQGHGHGQYALTANLGDSATKDVGTGSTNVAAGNHTHSAATTSANGFMSSTDKTKLNGVFAGAEVNVQSDWDASSGDAQILNKPTVQYTSAIATGNNGLVPSAGSSGQFLAHDGTFQTPSGSSLTNEQVQDIVGAMFTGNTETNITASYQDADGTIDLAVENYPSKYTAQITFGQGAQGTNIDFTLTNGSGTVTHNGYILNHNLGTQALVASVRTPYDPADGNSDDQTPNTWNDLFDHLYWQHMDVGNVSGLTIDSNAALIATVNSSRLADDNYCAIAIPVDADDNPSRIFLVTLIG